MALTAAVAVVALPLAGARAETFVNVLTGGTAGVYYPLGVALAGIYSNEIPDVRATPQVTKASVENLTLLQGGRGELAFTLGDSLIDGYKGVEDAGFRQPLDKLRGIAAIYPNYVQIVATGDSGIRTLEDLRGKRISVGAPKSGTELNARAIFGAAGMTYEDFGKVEYLPFAESVELMKNRQIDATLQSAGLGVASLRDLSTAVPIQVVEVPAALIEQIGPPYLPATIPAGTYTGQDTDVPTATVMNYLVTHADVPDDLAYGMAKSLFDNLDELVAAHNAARAISLETALDGMPVPLHPGAERFYKEQGVM